MKITSVDIIAIARGGTGGRPVVCRVNTDDGIYGYGEAALAVGIGGGPVSEAIRDLAPLILGMDPFDSEVIWEKLRRASYWGLSNSVIIMAAISAIDIALWDIKGKACNLPVYKLLGGKQREELRSYASQVHFGWGLDKAAPDCPKTASPEWFYKSCKNAVSEGYDAIKIGILFHDEAGERMPYRRTSGCLSQKTLNMARERLAAAREASGPEVDIIIENHSLGDVFSTVQLAKMAEEYGILFIEEAIQPLNAQSMLEISGRITIPLATGERTFTRWGFLPFLENGSLAVLQPDMGNCGGITEAKKICDMAAAYEIPVQIHIAATPIIYAASLHVEVAIPNFAIHEHHINYNAADVAELCVYDYSPRNGAVTAPELPGIGQELSEAALQKADIITVK